MFEATMDTNLSVKDQELIQSWINAKFLSSTPNDDVQKRVVVFGSMHDNGIVDGDFDIDSINGQYQKIVVNSNCKLNMIPPDGPCTIYLHICQGEPGGSITFPDVYWPGGVPRANAVLPDGSGYDLLMIHYIGNDVYLFEMMQRLKLWQSQ